MKISTPDSDVEHSPPAGTLLLGYRGSHAHNLYVPKDDPNSIDDIDLMGFVVAPIETYFGLQEWGSRGTKDFWEGRLDLVYYEIRKAFSLLLGGNPNIMSMLWMRRPDYLLLTVSGKEILDARELFVGKHVYNSFAGYASGQLHKMESQDRGELAEYIGITNELKRRGAHPNNLGEEIPAPGDHPKHFGEWGVEKLRQRLASFRKKGENIGYMGDKRKHLVLEHGYDAKNAAHCIRLLRMCVEFLGTGEMKVYREADRQELLDIKAGKWKLEDVKALAESLFADAKAARDASPLTDGPDYKGAEKLLVEIIQSEVK